MEPALPTDGCWGWPFPELRLGWAAMTSQQVRFVGGEADGLVDGVEELDAGRLPDLMECLGSVYRLIDARDDGPEYRFLRAALDSESTAEAPILDPPTRGETDLPAELRDQAGRQRDVAAHSRDEAGDERDESADDRDRRAELRHHRVGGSEVDAPHAWVAAAAADREHARIDRQVGAADRVEAQHDRRDASADRSAAARDRQRAATDTLTGVHTQQAGLLELDRRLASGSWTDEDGLILAFVEVDRLTAMNDESGHVGGDLLLQAVAATLRSVLQTEDLIMRYGGHQFLCALAGVGLDVAGDRIDRVNSVLGRSDNRWSVTTGLAQWRPGESTASLIDRADADLHEQVDRP